MLNLLHMLCVACNRSFEREEGQDLVEYSLIVALVSLGSVTSMRVMSLGISTAFKDVSSRLLSHI